MSAFNNSTVISSFPPNFPFGDFLIAALISAFEIQSALQVPVHHVHSVRLMQDYLVLVCLESLQSVLATSFSFQSPHH